MTTDGPADDTVRAAISLITAGMLLPALPVALAGEWLVTAFSYGTFLTAIGVGFGLVAFAVVEKLDLDRATFVFMTVVWPWIMGFGGLLGVLLLNEGEQIPRGPVADIFHTLTGDPMVWGTAAGEFELFGYGATYMIAGLSGVVLSAMLRRVTGETVAVIK